MESDLQPPPVRLQHPLIGQLYILCSDKGVAFIAFDEECFLRGVDKLNKVYRRDDVEEWLENPPDCALETYNQLIEYLDGKRGAFNLPLDLSLTVSDFQRRVLEEVVKVPFGFTTTYGKISELAGGSARAVGTANSKNPISIIIPCHRVLGSDGNLRGYGGGIPIKEALLRLESSRLI
ncbi:MAG: methylated-DNA--[protein]-cysteine S-methyltransferase [FCB group bacterium]|nr:methylated-DNA--[protein]-cysteine S-methyltransferase [FCB group bacterium]